MASLKWLLLNGQTIQTKNVNIAWAITNRKHAYSLVIKLSCDGEEFVDVLQNDVLSSGINPSWSINGFQVKPDIELEKFYSASWVNINIIMDSKVLFEETFNLNDMHKVEFSNKATLQTYPQNSVLLEFGEFLLLSPKTYQNMPGLLDLKKLSLEQTRPPSPAQDVINPNTNVVKQDVLDKICKLTRHDMKAKRNCKISELNQLRSKLRDSEKQLERDQRFEAVEKSEIMLTTKAQGLLSFITEQELSAQIVEDSMESKKAQLIKLKFLLEARQIKLIGELRQLFPIERQDNGEYSIRGIELPLDLNITKDDDQIASALGYVVHSLLLISKYLEIPLRYQLLYMGSRSLIRDPIGSSANSTYPLFKRSIEKERFEKAIMWLKADIEQLLATRGLGYESSRHILWNLQVLYQGEICPKLTF